MSIHYYTFLLFIIIFSIFSCTNVDLTAERNKILALHNAQRDHHFNKDSIAFANQLADNFISVNRGEITSPTQEATIARYNGYFSSVEFLKWDDVSEPIIRFSDDGSMAYTIVDKIVEVTYEEDGIPVKGQTHFAWTAIYTKQNGEWKIESVSSTNKPVTINQNDVVPKVTGIGGVFFESKNPKALREWYGKHLGLAIDDYGSPFEFRNANRPEEINYLRWSPYDIKPATFAPSKKPYMINYRVQNIEALAEKLRENGVTILDKIETYDYGKFVHIMDIEGTKIQLWEPIDDFFTQMGGITTK